MGASSSHPHLQNLINRMNEPIHPLWFKYYWPRFCSGIPHSPRWEVTKGVHRLGTALGLEPAHLTRRDHGRARHAGPAQSPLLPPRRSQQPHGGSRDARRAPRTPCSAQQPAAATYTLTTHTQRPSLAPRTHRCPPLSARPFLCALANLSLSFKGNRSRCPRVPARSCASQAGGGRR